MMFMLALMKTTLVLGVIAEWGLIVDGSRLTALMMAIVLGAIVYFLLTHSRRGDRGERGS